MRTKIGLLALALVLVAGSGFAAEGLPWWSNPWTESFRSASTANLLEDDLDLMLDPARLSSIDGYRLYTNLSNIVSKGDEVFSNSSDGYYLIGGSGKLMELGHAGLLYDRYQYTYRDTNKTSQSTYVDLDANGTYDRRTVTDITNSQQGRYNDTHWWLGYGRDMGPGKLGVLFYHSAEDNLQRPWGDNYDAHTVVTDLNLNSVTSDVVTTYTRSSQVDRNVNGGALSYWMPMGDQMDLGLAGGINIYLANQYDTLTYHSRSYNPSAASANGITIDSTANLDIIPNDHVGLELNVRGAMVYKWSDNVKTRTDLMFSTLSGERSDGFINSEFLRTDAFMLPTGLNSTTTTRTRASDPVFQDNHSMGLMLFSKTTAQLGEKVEMSMGLGLGTSTRDNSMEYTSEYNERIVYNDGDPILLTDYTTITTGSYSYTHMTTQSNNTIVLPVGVEFHITKPFVFRLGASPGFNFYQNSDTYHYEFTPNKVTNINATNDTTETVPANYTSTNGISYDNQYSHSFVDYSYGAGWKISDNLQIDLMGFVDWYTLADWKLSATFKF